jgi:tagaturonate reductase
MPISSETELITEVIILTKRIIQFGTSRFLQAHADLFIHEAREAGQDIGPITVVKSTSGKERVGRIQALSNPEGYPVIIRGMANNQVINETYNVRSIDSAMIADRDWLALKRLFVHDAEVIISNVSESGYDVPRVDMISQPAVGLVPISFPAKLLSLLKSRFDTTGRPILMLPCELVSENGRVLRQILITIAMSWKLPAQFLSWLDEKVVICDTLVDRIVSEAIEPVGAIGEPYALWAIKREQRYEFPFSHPLIILTDDLTPFLRLKLHILNLGHSFLADIWLREQRPSTETVRQALDDPTVKNRLLEIYRSEIVPGFTVRGMRDESEKYIVKTVERFQNPFLDHRLSDIFQNHVIKIERRVIDFMTWVREIDQSIQFEKLEAFANRNGLPAI